MSRALDQHTIASLNENPQNFAYRAISRALTPPAEGLLEIELLPKSHVLQPGECVVQDGQAIAVSKAALVGAFFVARRILMAYREEEEEESAGDILASEGQALAATAVLLLMDAEHMTAANTRKRLIQAALARPTDARSLLKREQALMLSFFTSRLHRHTKSPTLWGHLRWVTDICRSRGVNWDDVILQRHFDAVLVAAERHPRNYYAWCYARWIFQLEGPDRRPGLIEAAKNWCVRHHNDTSGWSFLYYVLNDETVRRSTMPGVIFEEVLGLASRLKWTNESVWVFLRTLAASGIPGANAVGQLQAALTTLQEMTVTEGDNKAKITLERASSWLSRHQINAP